MNVGVSQDNNVLEAQGGKIAIFAGHAAQRLHGGSAVVGLSETQPKFAPMFVRELQQQGLGVDIATHDTNGALRRIPQQRTYVVLASLCC